MLWRQKILRISAALGVAFAAAHTAERLKAPGLDQSLLISAARLATEDPPASPEANPGVPKSASLSSPAHDGLGDLVGVTPVAAATPAAGGDHCRPELALAAMPGAMIHLALSAPCNRNERIIVRHSGLSFSARTQSDGQATLVLPALKTDAMVAVYLQDAKLVLGKVTVADAAAYARYAIVWELPAQLELRVTDGAKVLVGSASATLDGEQGVMALGSAEVQAPVLARVYSAPGPDLGQVDITGELRITPASCGQTLRFDTIASTQGRISVDERAVAVPLCGTAGDILVLKNLAPAPKIAAPK